MFGFSSKLLGLLAQANETFDRVLELT
jgi:hypothetical protein